MNRIIALLLAASVAASVNAQLNSDNFIYTVELLDGQASDSIKTIQYFDGLGRLEQTVTRGSSPEGLYLDSRNVYDALDRVTQEWLPVTSGTANRLAEQTFIDTSYFLYNDSCARTSTLYDGLGRVVETRRPGETYQDRPQVASYSTNAAYEVKQYAVEGGLPVMKGYYDAGTLSLTVTKDEDQRTTAVYRELSGSIILERRAGDIDTYYVYDEMGRLRYVLPPKYQDNPTPDLYAFQYTYDAEGRIETSKFPGCQPVHYWYDIADRVVRMQDGELASQGKYRVYGYDGLGRLATQSIARASGVIEYEEIENHYDRYEFLNPYVSVIDSGTVSSHLRGNLNHSTGRLTGVIQRASNGETILTSYAYDQFGRIARKGVLGLGGHLTVCDYSYNFVGDITHERYREYELSGSTYSRSLEAQIEKKYDYPHTKLLSSSVITIHNPNSGVSAIDTIMNLEYDDFGRITANVRSGSDSVDMHYAYDKLQGWVTELSTSGGFKQRLYREDNPGHELYNGSISAMTWRVTDDPFERRYEYEYDDLNRLTEGAYSQSLINQAEPTINDSLIFPGPHPGFMNPLSLIPSIDSLGISINARGRYTERISYDKNCNITSIERYGMNNQRHYGLIDSLVITRNGNQLKAIEDYAQKHLTYTGASDFYDGDSSSSEYLYNANGSLVTDFNREIDWTYYDNIGNTREICFYDHSTTEYIYAADGTKLRTIHHPASSSSLTDSIDYIGNLILKNGKPSMYLFDGGYASFNTNGAVNGWHYYIQDYMGNNRMVVNRSGTTEQITHYYPYGGVIGDISTNENVQKYKFEGKELDRTFGLDNYDIHARQYFAMMPMWDRIDKLAEKYYGISPYTYCGGDPVNLGDYNGRDVCVLISPWDAHGLGHMAILIQKEDDKGNKLWYLYSKNGTNEDGLGSFSGPSKGDDIAKGSNKINESKLGFKTVEDFLNSDVNRTEEGDIRYAEGYLIECDSSQDEKARNGALEYLGTPQKNKDYDAFERNCAQTVQNALSNAGLQKGDPSMFEILCRILMGARSNDLFDLIPNVIYERIKQQNQGDVISL